MEFEILLDGDNLGGSIPTMDIKNSYSGGSFADMYAPAVTRVESNYKPRAVSSAGAQGLMQIMPATGREVAQKLGMKSFDPFDPQQNEIVGKAYLNQMFEQFQDPQLAFAAYNAGPGRIGNAIQKGGTRDFSQLIQMTDEQGRPLIPEETRNYVPKVLNAYGQNVQVQGQSDYAANAQPEFEILLDGDSLPSMPEAQTSEPAPVIPEQREQYVPSEPETMGWGEYARGLGGQAAQGLTFNFADELGLIDPELSKRMQAEYPKASIAANIAGGAALPLGAAKSLTKAPSLVSALLGAGPKTAAATSLGRVAQGAGYGAAYGGLAGVGAGEGAEDRIAKGAKGAAFGGAAGGAVSGLVNALMGKAPTLSAGEKLLSKRLKEVPEDVLQGAESTLRNADQPVFLPEALGAEDFYDTANRIANKTDTKDIAQALIKARQEAQPSRTAKMLDDIAPYSKPAEASGKLKGASEKLAEALKQERGEIANSNYAPIYKETPVLQEEIVQEILRTPVAKKAYNSVKESREYIDFPENSTEVIHAVKGELMERSVDAFKNNKGRLGRKFKKEADFIRESLNKNVKGMADADKAHAGLSENIEDITKDSLVGTLLDKKNLTVGNFGSQLLSSKVDAKEIKKLVSSLGDEGEDLVLSAVRAELSDRVANRVGGKNTISIFDKEALKGRLTDILGESKASKLIKKIDEEVLISEGTNNYKMTPIRNRNQENEGAERVDKAAKVFSYYGSKPTRAVGDALQFALGKLLSPSRQALQDEARMIFSNEDAASALASILKSSAKQKSNQESFSRLLPYVTSQSKTIPTIEIKNSYSED